MQFFQESHHFLCYHVSAKHIQGPGHFGSSLVTVTMEQQRLVKYMRKGCFYLHMIDRQANTLTIFVKYQFVCRGPTQQVNQPIKQCSPGPSSPCDHTAWLLYLFVWNDRDMVPSLYYIMSIRQKMTILLRTKSDLLILS